VFDEDGKMACKELAEVLRAQQTFWQRLTAKFKGLVAELLP
jgi:hypothetical protein